VLRRSPPVNDSVAVGALVLDGNTPNFLFKTELKLTTEFKLLHHLAKHAARPQS
jgi:DNA-binding response OmpR family regulator